MNLTPPHSEYVRLVVVDLPKMWIRGEFTTPLEWTDGNIEQIAKIEEQTRVVMLLACGWHAVFTEKKGRKQNYKYIFKYIFRQLLTHTTIIVTRCFSRPKAARENFKVSRHYTVINVTYTRSV